MIQRCWHFAFCIALHCIVLLALYVGTITIGLSIVQACKTADAASIICHTVQKVQAAQYMCMISLELNVICDVVYIVRFKIFLVKN